MKTNKLLSVAITALVALASTAWAGPQGGGGGGHFGGGGFSGGHGGGGFRGGQFGGFGAGHFGSAGVTSFNGGGIGAAPTFSGGGGARFSGNRSIAGINRTPQQFSYYSWRSHVCRRATRVCRQAAEPIDEFNYRQGCTGHTSVKSRELSCRTEANHECTVLNSREPTVVREESCVCPT